MVELVCLIDAGKNLLLHLVDVVLFSRTRDCFLSKTEGFEAGTLQGCDLVHLLSRDRFFESSLGEQFLRGMEHRGKVADKLLLGGSRGKISGPIVDIVC